jgi:cytidylate kinase
MPADFEKVLAETHVRDRQDSTRADSPLTYDQSYTVIDTSDLSIDEVVERIVAGVRGLVK